MPIICSFKRRKIWLQVRGGRGKQGNISSSLMITSLYLLITVIADLTKNFPIVQALERLEI